MLKERFVQCGLTLHPEKTKIVYCKDSSRKGNSQYEKFDFLGYTFRPRTAKNKHGKLFTNFSPAMSDKVKQKKREAVKEWFKGVKPTRTLKEVAAAVNPVVRGWVNHYGKYHASELWGTMQYIDTKLIGWAGRKYAKLKHSWRKGNRWLAENKKRKPSLFQHWLWMKRNDLNRRAV